MQLVESQIFASHYRLERLLGRGGFSEVWLAYDETADVKVAIKVYAPGTGLDNDGVELFRKEFKIVFDMNHTNLLRPNYFSVEDNMPYLVMPYIERGSTNKMIGKMPETEVWKFIRDVASGLAYLHSFEPPIIHQDIKPDNVMLMNNGTYVITDFGISTRARSTLRKSVNANENAGTQAYMGPERFSKQPAPIKASDVWSLGATVYELMEGDAPFGNFGGINQKSGAEIPDINGAYSNDLKELVYACLAMETWDRPTAEQLSDYASDKLKGRSPEMTWKKEKPFEQPENRGERKTEPFVKPKPEPEPEPRPKPKTWLWIFLAVLVFGGGFALYKSNESKKFAEQQRIEQQRIEQERLAKEQQNAADNAFFQNCSTIADYRAYLNKYPNGLNKELAKNKINKHIADSTAKANEAERQRQIAAENERQRQIAAEAERQRQIAAENEQKAREAEEERQRQIALANERKAIEAGERPNITNGHKAVDLGLPSGTLWATCNVGANSPEDYGNYYAWGETTTKGTYNWSTYKWCRGSYDSQTKYCTKSSYGTVDNRKVLEMTDDAARTNWGGSWRMPTYDELKELKTKCTWTWTTQGGKNGYRVTGPNGKSIFLPAAGYRLDGGLYDAGSDGYYWSSSLSADYPYLAYYLYFNSGKVDMNGSNRYYGRSVRPVSAPQN